MRLRSFLILVLFSAFIFAGCKNWTVENPNPESQIVATLITPEKAEAESVVDLSITAEVKLPKIFADAEKYEIKLFDAAGNEFKMFDDGQHNDIDANDGIYGTVFESWQVPDAEGIVKFEIRTIHKKNIQMYSKQVQFEVLEKKVPPKVESFMIEPKEIEVILEHKLKFTAQVSDANGLDDISEVTLDLTNFGGDERQAMTPDVEAGEGFYSFTLENFKSPDQVMKMAATVEVVDKADMTDTMGAEISTYPTPNHAPSIEKITINPPKIYFDTTISIAVSAQIYDEEGYNDIKTVTVDMSSLGFENERKMLDDGRHFDNILRDGIFGYYVEDFIPIREAKTYEVKFKVTDSKGESAEMIGTIEVIDPASMKKVKNPTLDDADMKKASDELQDKFRSLFDGMTSSVLQKETGEGDNKVKSTKIIITEENTWDPGISGYTGFQEGGMKIVIPVSWTITRKHNLDTSNWRLDFTSGYINIEMVPYKVGDETTLLARAKEYHETLKQRYNEKKDAGEILNLNFDERFNDYNRFLDEKAIWFDFYIVSKDDQNYTHSVYMFYAKEATSTVENPIYRTYKVEFVRNPLNITSNAFDIFVDNFIVN